MTESLNQRSYSSNTVVSPSFLNARASDHQGETLEQNVMHGVPEAGHLDDPHPFPSQQRRSQH